MVKYSKLDESQLKYLKACYERIKNHGGRLGTDLVRDFQRKYPEITTTYNVLMYQLKNISSNTNRAKKLKIV